MPSAYRLVRPGTCIPLTCILSAGCRPAGVMPCNCVVSVLPHPDYILNARTLRSLHQDHINSCPAASSVRLNLNPTLWPSHLAMLKFLLTCTCSQGAMEPLPQHAPLRLRPPPPPPSLPHTPTLLNQLTALCSCRQEAPACEEASPPG